MNALKCFLTILIVMSSVGVRTAKARNCPWEAGGSTSIVGGGGDDFDPLPSCPCWKPGDVMYCIDDDEKHEIHYGEYETQCRTFYRVWKGVPKGYSCPDNLPWGQGYLYTGGTLHNGCSPNCCLGSIIYHPVVHPVFPINLHDANSASAFIGADVSMDRIQVIDLNSAAVVYDHNESVSPCEQAEINIGSLDVGRNYIVTGYLGDYIHGFLSFRKQADGVQQLPRYTYWHCMNDEAERQMTCVTYLGNNRVQTLTQFADKSIEVAEGYTSVVIPPCLPAPWNMAAWWTFDENAGTTANDSAGNINDQGTLNNGANFTSSGKVAGGLLLDGLDDFVEVADSPELNFGTGDLSIDAWVKTSAASGIKAIVDKRAGTVYDPNGYILYLYDGNLRLQLSDGTGGYRNYNSSLFVADGNWRHVAATVDRDDPNGLVLYVDGASETFDPRNMSGDLSNEAELLIGKDTFITGKNFNGEIDEVELYNRALSGVEIKAIFEAGTDGKCKPEPEWDCEKADLYQDGIVNWKDLAILANCWLESCR